MDQKPLFDLIPSKTAFWIGFATAILVLGTLGFIFLGSCLLRGSCSLPSFEGKTIAVDKTQANTDNNTAPSGEIPVVTADEHIRGDKNAPITLIEYSDFQCPFCKAYHPTVKQVMDQYKGKVRWVYRHFPLSFHPNAEPAALASECASEQGKFWEFADALFANQDSLGDDFYKKLAADNKLNLNKFNDCVSSGKYLEKIRTQAQDGGNAGVTGTPGSFLISKEGRATPITGAVPLQTLTAEIDKLLAK